MKFLSLRLMVHIAIAITVILKVLKIMKALKLNLGYNFDVILTEHRR